MPTAARRIAYGPDPAQFGELYLPDAADGLRGTVVVIHGGFWRAQYDCSLGRPLARDLAGRGYTAWNIEYRRVGNGGGWPATLVDVAAAVDQLAHLDVDTSRVVTVGHSAGGHLAVWAAGRHRLRPGDPGAQPTVEVGAAVAQAGVLDLATAARNRVGRGAVTDLLGARLDDEPRRWEVADPMAHLPIGVPVVCVHAPGDDDVPFAQSRAYVEQAVAAGDPARLLTAAGDHYSLIDPASSDWQLVLDVLPELAHGAAG